MLYQINNRKTNNLVLHFTDPALSSLGYKICAVLISDQIRIGQSVFLHRISYDLNLWDIAHSSFS